MKDMENRVERARLHRSAQRIEGEVIRREVQRERDRWDGRVYELVEMNMKLHTKLWQTQDERDALRKKLDRRSLWRVIVGAR